MGLDSSSKDDFYDNLHSVMAKISDQETVIISGDFNGHIGRNPDGFEGIHGGYGYGQRNPEGDRILEFATAHNLVVGNSFFTRPEKRLVTYKSGAHVSQIDYILLRKADLKRTKNIKVIAGEECVTQHRLLVCDLTLKFAPPRHRPYIPKLRLWKLREQEHCTSFSSCVGNILDSSDPSTSVEDLWTLLKSSLLDSAEKVCGRTKKRSFKKVTWWWNRDVNEAVLRKRRAWKEWQRGGSKEQYVVAKREAKWMIRLAKRLAEERVFQIGRSGRITSSELPNR